MFVGDITCNKVTTIKATRAESPNGVHMLKLTVEGEGLNFDIFLFSDEKITIEEDKS